MSDGFKSAAQLVGEAIVKPVVDEVGLAIEQGTQTAGLPLPNNQAQKPHNQHLPNQQQLQQDDARKKRNIMHFLQNYKQQEQALKQTKTKEDQQKQQEEAKDDQKIRQFEFVKQKKDQDINLQRQKTRSERKSGVGG